MARGMRSGRRTDIVACVAFVSRQSKQKIRMNIEWPRLFTQRLSKGYKCPFWQVEPSGKVHHSYCVT